MQAIYAKTTEEVKMFLDEVAADMEILNYNIRESNIDENQKTENIRLIKQLRENIYDTMKKLK